MRRFDSQPDVTCSLEPGRATAREAAFRRTLLPRYAGVEELEDGYTLVFDGVEKTLSAATAFVAEQHRCCAFAAYRVAVDPPYEQTRLTITGPEGTKSLFREGLVARLEERASADNG